jgi:PPOX class probable F420-dependent enzyme
MELSDALAFATARQHGILVTIGRSGRPQMSNILYGMTDGVARISVTDSRAKTRNLRRDRRASLYVVGDTFWEWVVLDGTAELSAVAAAPDDAVVDELVEMYGAAVGEHKDWDDFRKSMVNDQRLVVRVRAERAYGLLGA